MMPQPTAAIVLVASQDERGIWRAMPGEPYPSFFMEIDYRSPAWKQIASRTAELLGEEPLSATVEVEGPLTPQLTVNGAEASLYISRLEPGKHQAPTDWLTIPQVLRALPRDRSRLPYLKTLQILSGALEGEVNAIEIDDKVREALMKKPPAD